MLWKYFDYYFILLVCKTNASIQVLLKHFKIYIRIILLWAYKNNESRFPLSKYYFFLASFVLPFWLNVTFTECSGNVHVCGRLWCYNIRWDLLTSDSIRYFNIYDLSEMCVPALILVLHVHELRNINFATWFVVRFLKLRFIMSSLMPRYAVANFVTLFINLSIYIEYKSLNDNLCTINTQWFLTLSVYLSIPIYCRKSNKLRKKITFHIRQINEKSIYNMY